MIARNLFPSRLQIQLVLIVVSALAAGSWAVWSGGWPGGAITITPVDPLFALLAAGGAACAIGAAWQAKFHRLVALILLGGAGLVTCLTFAWFSAPDLALTQISVETVTTVLFLLGLRWLPRRLGLDDPRRRTLRSHARRVRDATLAIAAGSGLAVLAFAVLTRPGYVTARPILLRERARTGGRQERRERHPRGLPWFRYARRDHGGGQRRTHCLFALAPLSPRPREHRGTEGATRNAMVSARPEELLPRGYMKVPAVLVRLLLPMAGLVSLHFLLRGHNAPGGGFVGGLVMATAIIAQYMVSGTIWVESRLRIHPQVWIALGLLAASLAGIGAWFGAKPFLTRLRRRFHAAVARRRPRFDRTVVRSRGLHARGRSRGADADRARASVVAQPAQARSRARRTMRSRAG